MQWVPINGLDNYDVSEDGQVRSHFGKGCIIKPGNSEGSITYKLSHRGKSKIYYAHRLVAEHFLNLKDTDFIGHKDGDLTNNHYTNLIIMTTIERKTKLTSNTQILNSQVEERPLVKECKEYAEANGIAYEDQVRYCMFFVDKPYKLFVSSTSDNVQFFYNGLGEYTKEISVHRFANPRSIFKWAKQFILEDV
jgi:hypothetical protein